MSLKAEQFVEKEKYERKKRIQCKEPVSSSRLYRLLTPLPNKQEYESDSHKEKLPEQYTFTRTITEQGKDISRSATRPPPRKRTTAYF